MIWVIIGVGYNCGLCGKLRPLGKIGKSSCDSMPKPLAARVVLDWKCICLILIHNNLKVLGLIQVRLLAFGP